MNPLEQARRAVGASWGVPWRLVRVLVSRDRRAECASDRELGWARPLRVRCVLQGVGESGWTQRAGRRYLLADVPVLTPQRPG